MEGIRAILEFLDKFAPAAGNVVALLVIIYAFADLMRNWNGSPELRIIREQMIQMNSHLGELMERLSR